MSRLITTLIFSVTVVMAVAGEDDRLSKYLGCSGVFTLPQGGSAMRHVGGAALRGGVYTSESLAIEGEIGWMENTAMLAAQGLWHWAGSEIYDYYFGYSRFDPFFTFGARGWMGKAGQVGPKVGAGAFYHLDDNWSLRFGGDALLGVDSRVEILYTLELTIQYEF